MNRLDRLGYSMLQVAFVSCLLLVVFPGAVYSDESSILSIEASGGTKFKFSWPAEIDGHLERTSELGEGAEWLELLGSAFKLGDRYEKEINFVQKGSAFFRLVYIDPPTRIESVSPASEENHVGVLRKTIVQFSGPIDSSTIDDQSFYILANGEPVSGYGLISPTSDRITFFYDEALPASTELRIYVKGDRILDVDGNAVDANNDGIPGGELVSSFRTLSLTRVKNTNVFGYVYDSFTGEPIEGATIRVDAFEEANSVTDTEGYFELIDMPAPDFFVHIDGSTAVNIPEGFTYPSVGKKFHSIPGERIQLIMDNEPFDIYLPLKSLDDLQAISAEEDTLLSFGSNSIDRLSDLFPEADPEIWDRMSVRLTAGSAIDENGIRAMTGTIMAVPPDRLPAPLPEGIETDLVISIQVDGASVFNDPAPVVYPNLSGLKPGEKNVIYSFNHDAGRWDVIGTGTVSEDGLSIVSDPGVGVTAPGWGFVPRDPGSPIDDGPVFIEEPEPEDCGFFKIARLKLMLHAIAFQFDLQPGTGDYAGDHLRHYMDNHRPAVPIEYDINSNPVTDILQHDAFHNLHDRVANELYFRVRIGNLNDFEFINRCPQEGVEYPGETCFNFYNQYSIPDVSQLSLGFGGVDRVFATVTGIQTLDDRNYTATVHYRMDDFYDFHTQAGETDGAAKELADCGAANPFPIVVEFSVPISVETFGLPYDISEDDPLYQDLFGAPNIIDVIPESQSFEEDGNIITVNPDDTISYSNELLRPEGLIHIMIEDLDTNTVIARQSTTQIDSPFSGIVLAPNQNYRAWALDNRTLSLGYSDFITQDSGATKQIERIILSSDQTEDSDGDGLDNLRERVIGTSSELADTDSDGLIDSIEILEGLDPLGGFGFPTGVISGLSLPGEANGIAIKGSTDSETELTAYIATGSHGLGIVDASQFNDPIILGQIELDGDTQDVAVDNQLSIAAVSAQSAGLHLVDVVDKAIPDLIRTLNANSTQVEVFNGVAFTSDDSNLVSYDLLTGELIQLLNLDGSTITGMSREGDHLYTMDNFGKLHAIKIIGIEMQERGNVTVSTSGGKIFTGNDLVYAALSQNNFGGYATIDVSNPDQPTIIGGSTFGGAELARTAIVTNGSGTGLLIGEAIGDSIIDIMDTNDPAGTREFVSQIGLFSDPQNVSIAGGVAFLAGGEGDLVVVNYLPFDTQGIPPEVTLDISSNDMDQVNPGVQIEEGKLVSLTVEVSDDVQVKNVELFVNGVVTSNDLSFPWDFEFLAPDNALTNQEVRVQVRATDTGGNSVLSDMQILEVIEDQTPPTLINQNLTDKPLKGTSFRTIRLGFNEPMDIETLIEDHFQLTPLSTPESPITPTDIRILNNGSTIQLTYLPFALGEYRLTIDRVNIRDIAGNAFGSDDIIMDFEIVDYTIRWIRTSNGFWNDASNWEPARIPGPNDDVLISVEEDIVVTHSDNAGSTKINSLRASNKFILFGGRLDITGTMQIDDVLEINRGTLANATVLPSENGEDLLANALDGRMDSITLNRNMTIMPGERITILNGLTLNASVALIHNEAFQSTWMFFDGTQTLNGSGSIHFDFIDRVGFESDSNHIASRLDSTLTIGEGITIYADGGFIGYDQQEVINKGTIFCKEHSLTFDGSSFFNEGIIRAQGGNIDIRADAWSNEGGLELASGSLSLNGEWMNSGKIAVVDGTLNLGGSFSSDDVNRFYRIGGTVNLTGSVLNTDSRLELHGDWNSINGEILGGRVFSDAGKLIVRSSSLTLNSVILETDLDIHSSTSTFSNHPGSVRVRNGLELHGQITVEGTPGNDFFAGTMTTAVDFEGNHSLEGTGTVRLTSTSTAGNHQITVIRPGEGGSLNIGKHISIIGESKGAQIGENGRGLLNKGTITSEAQTLNIRGDTWINEGSLIADDGQLSLEGLENNQGIFQIASSNSITIDGNYTQDPSGELIVAVSGPTDPEAGQLIVNGVANLDGILSIQQSDDFLPLEGVDVPISTYNSTTGSFDFARSIGFPSEYQVALQTEATQSRVQIVEAFDMISSLSPANYEVVEASEPTITITFDQAIDPLTVTLDSISLLDVAGNFIEALESEAATGNLSVELDTESLPDGQYNICIDGTLLQDQIGDPLGTSIMYSTFTVDTESPSIIGATPELDFTFESTFTSIQLDFSESLKASTLNAETVLLLDSGEQPIDLNILIQDNGTTVVLGFIDLADGDYLIRLEAASILDLGNTALGEEDIEYHFTIESQSPYITKITPQDCSINSPDLGAVEIILSEPVNPLHVTEATFQVQNSLGETLSPFSLTHSNGGRTIQLTYPEFPIGNYSIRVDAPAIEDRAENTIGSTVFTSLFQIQGTFLLADIYYDSPDVSSSDNITAIKIDLELRIQDLQATLPTLNGEYISREEVTEGFAFLDEDDQESESYEGMVKGRFYRLTEDIIPYWENEEYNSRIDEEWSQFTQDKLDLESSWLALANTRRSFLSDQKLRYDTYDRYGIWAVWETPGEILARKTNLINTEIELMEAEIAIMERSLEVLTLND